MTPRYLEIRILADRILEKEKTKNKQILVGESFEIPKENIPVGGRLEMLIEI